MLLKRTLPIKPVQVSAHTLAINSTSDFDLYWTH